MSAMASRRRGPWTPLLLEGLKRLAWPLFLLGLLGLLGGLGRALWLEWSDPRVWPVGEVVVTGIGAHADEATLREALIGETRRGFLRMDLRRAREAVKQEAWVARAVLTREWPNRLRVEIEEHQPLARWRGDEVMNTRGKVFRPALESIPDGLPVLIGPEGRQWWVWERYNTLAGVLDDAGLVLIGVREDERGSLDLLLAEGVRIRVGREDVEARIQRFLDVYPRTVKTVMEAVAAVDLRYTNGFSVKWRDESTRPEMDDNATGGRNGA